jgi:hypothetical protein
MKGQIQKTIKQTLQVAAERIKKLEEENEELLKDRLKMNQLYDGIEDLLRMMLKMRGKK